MSFILEALRKSEQERQRNQSPGMADLYARNRPSGRRYWLPLVIFLVGLNIGLLLFLWINGAPPTNPPVATTSVDVGAAGAEAPSNASGSELASTTSSNVPAAGTDASPEPAETELAQPTGRELASELTAPPPPQRETVPAAMIAGDAADVAAQTSAYANLPTLEELTLAGSISLSPLHIDMHVFSPLPAERFVFINMNKYREGDSLREGPLLTAITEDGVVLAHQGRSFLVTRE